MKLTEQAITKAKETKTLRLKLALALGFTEQWIIKSLDRNTENGPLTTIQAIQIIMKETGLKQKQVIQVEPASA